MRNHKKIKMLRNKFGQVLGYAFWSMILEYLTESDGNEMEYSNEEFEMFASELGIDQEKTKEIIDYCIKRELLFMNDGLFIYSISLNEYLKPVYDKRHRAKESSKTRQRRENGRFCHRNTDSVGETVTEKPEIKTQEPIQESVTSEPEPEPEIQYVEAEEVDVFKPRKTRKSKNQPDKILYGTDVRMTLDEYQKLIGEYGNTATERMIQILDNYKVSNGKSYKDDYRAILSWVVDRYQKDQQYGKQQQSNSLSQKGKNADALINSMYS